MSLAVVNSGSQLLNSRSISTSTQATPVVVTTTAAHGFVTGDRVRITGCDVGALNGIWIITFVSTTTFSLDGSTNPAASATTGTVGVEITLHTTTGAGGFVLGVDLGPMATNDIIDVVDKGKILSAGTQRDRKRTVFSNAQDPQLIFSDVVPVGAGQHKFALCQYKGTPRTIDWAVFRAT